jgi:large subunit ribosomal protein L23
MKAAALRGALSDRAAHGRVHVVSSFTSGDAPRTKDALSVLLAATGTAPSAAHLLVVTQPDDTVTWKSLRNVAGVHLLDAGQLNTYDVLVSDHVVFTEAALGEFLARSGFLLKPVISEKSYRLADDGKYTFIVAPGSNKTQIRQAVEAVFRVKVTGVNTVNRQGKRRRTRFGWGKRPDTKRAIVTLAEGERIDIFGGPVS